MILTAATTNRHSGQPSVLSCFPGLFFRLFISSLQKHIVCMMGSGSKMFFTVYALCSMFDLEFQPLSCEPGYTLPLQIVKIQISWLLASEEAN